jgi:hypothetical protein
MPVADVPAGAKGYVFVSTLSELLTAALQSPADEDEDEDEGAGPDGLVPHMKVDDDEGEGDQEEEEDEEEASGGDGHMGADESKGGGGDVGQRKRRRGESALALAHVTHISCLSGDQPPSAIAPSWGQPDQSPTFDCGLVINKSCYFGHAPALTFDLLSNEGHVDPFVVNVECAVYPGWGNVAATGDPKSRLLRYGRAAVCFFYMHGEDERVKKYLPKDFAKRVRELPDDR